jgi:hypothetical protein
LALGVGFVRFMSHTLGWQLHVTHASGVARRARSWCFNGWLAALLAVLPGVARAAGDGGSADEGFFQPSRAASARTYVDLRGGFSSANSDAPLDVCLEVAPLKFWTVETCGTGAGTWRGNQGTQMAHLRTELQPYRFTLGGVAFDPQFGLGISELQMGPDDAGLRFGNANGKFDTTGPEATLSLQAKVPARFDLELVIEATLGVAYFSHAPQMVLPREPTVPFAAFSAGIGF